MSHFSYINALIKRENLLTGAELGVREGLFSEYLLSRNPGLFMYCVDAWEQIPGMQKYPPAYDHDGHYVEAVKRLNPYLDDRADMLIGSIVEGAFTIRHNSLDFIFHDASHDYKSVKEDIQAWYPKVKEGGWITGHDWHKSRGVFQFVNEVCRKKRIGGSVKTTWICRKADVDETVLYA